MTLVALALATAAFADSSWGPWQYFANSVDISYARVNSTTLAWKFKNFSTYCTVEPFKFVYRYVDADTFQTVTANDIEPNPIKPGEEIGGWTAFSANTRVPLIANYAPEMIRCN